MTARVAACLVVSCVLPAVALAQADALDGQWLVGATSDSLNLLLTIDGSTGRATRFEFDPPRVEVDDDDEVPTPPEPPTELAVTDVFEVVPTPAGAVLRCERDGVVSEVSVERQSEGVARVSVDGDPITYTARRVGGLASTLIGEWNITVVPARDEAPTAIAFEVGTARIATGRRGHDVELLGLVADGPTFDVAIQQSDGLFAYYRFQLLEDDSLAGWRDGHDEVWLLYRGERPDWHPPDR